MPSGDVLRCYHHLGHFSWDEQLLQVRAWLDPAGPVLMFSGAVACSVGKEKAFWEDLQEGRFGKRRE